MDNKQEKQTSVKPRRKGLWWKIPLFTLIIVILLLVAACGLVLHMLTPERLTQLVNKYGTEYLDNGLIDAQRVELTWWSSFPHFEIAVDSLTVKSLHDSIPDTMRDILKIERFHGDINLASLMAGEIEIHDVTIVRPEACVYIGNNGISNLNIFPPSDSPAEQSAPIVIPPLSVNRFLIEGEAPLRYVSLPDSINAQLTIDMLNLESNDPHYSVKFTSRPSTNLVELPDSFNVGFNGNVYWDPQNPMSIGLKNFDINAGEISLSINADADMNEPPTIHSLEVATNEISPEYLVSIARKQPSLSQSIPEIECDGRLIVKAILEKPYVITDTLLPAISADIELTDGPIAIPSMKAYFSNLGIQMAMQLNPTDIDSSVVTLKRLSLTGGHRATSLSLKGTATNLLSDPAINGNFNGSIQLAMLPPALLKAIGMNLNGRFRASTDFKFNMSDLTASSFHRVKLNGQAHLSDFNILIPADSLQASVTDADLHFGTSQSFVTTGKSVDSLLTISVKIDTAKVNLPELSATMANMKMGIGCRNDGTFADSTTITPIGGIINIAMLRAISTVDSMRTMLKDATINARLSRFNGDKKIPQLNMGLDVRRIVYAQGLTRISLGKSKINVDMHMKPKRNMSVRTAGNDSTRRRIRKSPSDSIAITKTAVKSEVMDFGVDKETIRLLNRIDLDGELKASSGRLFTPSFPIRMRMNDLDFHFTEDSLNLQNVELTAGQSRFKANGLVSNIRRSVSAKRRVSPLKIEFNLHADTININELTQTAFRGAALVAATDSAQLKSMSSIDISDEELQNNVDSLDITEMAAILIPVNIDADLRFTANNIIYSNMMMHDFTGTILMNRGAVSLNNLHASTDIGSVDLNALYYAPTREDIDFAMGLQLNRFKIDRVIELMPALDSIMPILGGIGGIIDVTMGATAELDSTMNVKIPSIHAMMRMQGDSLVVLDENTYKTMAKWLMFKDKHKNMIDHMAVELSVENSMLELYPFMFDFDRYRLGVMGRNDLDLNLNYHVSVLKSPLPFKFGINITGPADDMKIRVGKARYKDNVAAEKVTLADSARVNLVNEMRNAFSRGVNAARVAPLQVKRHEKIEEISVEADTLSASDLQQLSLPEAQSQN